jgi:acetyl esterase/lipase
VILHGGGWTKGCKEDLRFVARGFSERGYVAMTVSYRLAPQHKFPAPLNDAKCAVRWLRAHAAGYRVDPDRVGVMGFSAGAHLALLMGVTEPTDGLEGDGGYPEQSSRVQAVVNLMGPTDLHRGGWPAVTDQLLADLLGGGRDQIPAAYWAASPVAYVHRGAAPVLTFHGTNDPLVPYDQAKVLHASLRQARVSSRLETIKGKGHGEDWTRDELVHNVAIIQEFLDKTLAAR